MASRVPYESAARVLAQSHKSFAGYTVRHGLAITMEHNFMVSPEGRTNFQNQLKQLIGSIQYSNDYDVHTALILAPSYAKTIDEKYYQQDKNVWQRCREYVDLFGIMQKNTNALDILIEEARSTLRSWGSQEPSFLLTNPKLTMQMTMTPEKTSYVAHGPEGQKLLKQGPSLPSYRGLNIINSRCFATEEGKRPRDMLDRRVRVAEYYVVSKVPCNSAGKPIYEEDYVELYDQSKDQMFKLTMKQLYDASFLPGDRTGPATTNDMDAFIQNAKKHGIKRPTARFWENNMANPANNKANSYRESKTFQPKTPSGSSKSSAPQMYGLRYGVYANPPAGGTGNTYPTPIEGETVTVRLEAALTGDDGEFWERMVRAAQSEKLIFHEDAFLSKNVELNEVWKEKAQYKGQNPKDFPQSALYHQQSNDDNTNYGAHTFVSYLPTFPEYDDTDDGKAAWAMQNSARPFVYVRAVSAQTGKAKQWLEDIEQLSGTEPFAIPDSVKTAIELIKNHPEKIDPAVAEATDAERPDAEYQAAASLYNNLHLHSALLLQTKAWMAEQSADTQVHSAREALVETTISSEAWKVLVDLNIDVLWWSDRDENKVSAVPNDLADEDIEVTRLYTSAYVSMHFLIACIYHAMDNTPNDKAAFAAMLQDMSYPGVDGQVNLDLTYRSESPNFWTALNGYMTGLKLERVSDYFSVTTGKMFAAFEDTATATAAAPPAPAAPPPPAASPAAPPAPQSAPPGASIAYVESLRDRIAALENAKNDMEAEARTQGQNHRNLETEVKTLEGQLQAYVNAQAAAATAAAGGGGGGGSGGGAAPDPAATATAIAAMQAQITTLTAEAAAAKTSAESARNAATTAGADLIRERRALQTLLATETTRAERAELAEVRRAMNEEAVLRQELADMQTEIASLKAVAGGGAALAAAAGALPAAAVPPEFRDFIVVRPCIEHQMLGVVMGRGGKDELGCTFWGQTELSVYDDSMHGKWGMSYKYHERAMVLNERNLVRCWDVAFNGYNGGNDDRIVQFNDATSVNNFRNCVADVSKPYCGDSIMVMSFKHVSLRRYSNPLVFQNPELGSDTIHIDPDNVHAVYDPTMELMTHTSSEDDALASYLRWKDYSELMPPFRQITGSQNGAGHNSNDEVTATSALAFQGTCKVHITNGPGAPPRLECQNGSGHLGPSYVGVASVREGKGLFFQPGASAFSFTRPM